MADNVYEEGVLFNSPGELGSGGKLKDGEGFTGALGERGNLSPSDKGLVKDLDRLILQRSPHHPEPSIEADTANPIREMQTNSRDRWPDSPGAQKEAAALAVGILCQKLAVFNEHLFIQPETNAAGEQRDTPDSMMQQKFEGPPVAGVSPHDDIGKTMKERPSTIGERGDYRDVLETYLKNLTMTHRSPDSIGASIFPKFAGPPGEPVVEDPKDKELTIANYPAQRSQSFNNLGKVPMPPGDSTGDYQPPGTLLGETDPSVYRPQSKVAAILSFLPKYLKDRLT